MKYFKSKGGRLYINENILIDTEKNEIIPVDEEPDTSFYEKCTKGEFLLAYKKVIKELDKLAGL